MCDFYGIPLALVFQEFIDLDKTEDKEQELAAAEQDSDNKEDG